MKRFVSFIIFFIGLYIPTALSFSMPQLQHTIHIHYLYSYFKQQQLKIDSQVMFRLSNEMEKALEHEIPLSFDIEFVLLENNQFFGIEYQSEKQSINYQITLSYFGYNKQYIITNERTQINQNFNNLKDALRTFGTLREFTITNLAKLNPKQKYTLKFRVKFDPWQLPTPLIINSFVNTDWYLSSEWFQKNVELPNNIQN